MKSQNATTNVESTANLTLRSHAPEASGKNAPSQEEIRQRAFEVHIERGGIHGCDLEDWLQAERELKEKYNQSNGEGRKSK